MARAEVELEELSAALWLFVDALEERLLGMLRSCPSTRRRVLEDAYDLLRSSSELVEDQMVRMVSESPLILLVPDPALISQRVAAAQDIARALNAREAAAHAAVEIRHSFAPQATAPSPKHL